MRSGMLFLILVILAELFVGAVSAQPVLSLNYSTLPETPSPGDVFVLQIVVVNSGYGIRDAKLTVSENEDDLAIISDGNEVSYLTINLGDIAGSALTSVKLRADGGSVYQVKVRLSYNYGTGSLEEVVPVVVVDRPSMVVENVVQPVIEPGESGKVTFEVKNGGGMARNVVATLSAPDGFVVETSRMSFDRWGGGEVRSLSFNIFGRR
ncbi:hypothetical protein [Geoglobus ahangari]